MQLDFTRVAPYLRDPLVLIGFFIFLAFLFSRGILKRGIVKPLPAKLGYRILQTILLYGFVIGLMLIALGFSLKHRQLTAEEERNATAMLRTEMSTNLKATAELLENCKTLGGMATQVAEQLRDNRFAVLPLLFPAENLRDQPISGRDAAILAMQRLEKSGLPRNNAEMQRFERVARLLSGTIDRTLPTMRSLADPQHTRWAISTTVWESQLSILRQVKTIDVSRVQNVNASLISTRASYDTVAARCIDYLESVNTLLNPANGEIDVDALARALATERLSMTMLSVTTHHSRQDHERG